MPGLTSLSKANYNKTNEQRGQAILYAHNSKDEPDPTNYFAFQYFPETISDTPSVNYQAKDIPGSSLPIYQYISNGARTISFTAVFSCDLDINDKNAVIAAAKPGISKSNIDIRAAIATLRKYMLPSYVGGRTFPPPKLLLTLANSGIGAAYGDSFGDDNSVLCVMTQCSATIEAYFPSNVPRIATVTLSFNQIAQFAGTVRFPQFGIASDQYLINNPYTVKAVTPPIPPGPAKISGRP